MEQITLNSKIQFTVVDEREIEEEHRRVKWGGGGENRWIFISRVW